MSVTIDASVFVAAARDEELHHEASLEFLERVQGDELPVYSPALVLPECAAAIARPTGNLELAERLVELVRAFPGIELVPLTPLLAGHAARMAMQYRLRGADAIYAATADLFGATLVAWDGEMLTRSAGSTPAMTPIEWLERQERNADAPHTG